MLTLIPSAGALVHELIGRLAAHRKWKVADLPLFLHIQLEQLDLRRFNGKGGRFTEKLALNMAQQFTFGVSITTIIINDL